MYVCMYVCMCGHTFGNPYLCNTRGHLSSGIICRYLSTPMLASNEIVSSPEMQIEMHAIH